MYEMKKVRLNDLFDMRRGNVISKEYINNNKGEYPVYSTQVDDVFGYINSYMLDGKYLLWNTDGLAGYIRITDGKFSFTNIVGIMIFKNDVDSENISLEYLKNYLEPIFRNNIKGRLGKDGKNEYTKLNQTMIQALDIKIPIPIKEDGSYDLKAQQEIVNKYHLIKEKKEALIKKKAEVQNINISFTDNIKTIYMEIKEICDKCQSDKSITKEKLKDKLQKYPVYAGSVGIPLGYSDQYNNEKKALLVINDGDAGKTYIVEDEKYTIGKHVTGLIIKDEYLNLIDLNYLQIVSEPIFVKKNKSQGRGNLPQRDIMSAYVPIPVTDDQMIDLKQQQQIANKYQAIENIKTEIIKKLDELIKIEIEF